MFADHWIVLYPVVALVLNVLFFSSLRMCLLIFQVDYC